MEMKDQKRLATEGKMILTFMGYGHVETAAEVYGANDAYITDNNICQDADYMFKFHSSLDWLMPVVDKVCTKKYNACNNAYFRYKMYYSGLTYHAEITMGDKGFLSGISMHSQLHAMYVVLIQFINWYNEQANKES